MGNENACREGLGWIPPQVGPHWETTLERTRWWMGVSPAGGSDVGCSITGGGDLRLPPPKHSCTVYCDQAYYGLVSSGGEEDGVKGGQAVVVSGQFGPGGDADGDLGGGTNGGVGGDGQDRDRDELNRWEGNVANVILGT